MQHPEETTTTTRAALASRGLRGLGEVRLGERSTRLLEAARQGNAGPAPWRRRKEAECRELLALGEIAPRLVVHRLDMRESFRADMEMRMPLPQPPDENDCLRVGDRAILGLHYREEAVRTPRAGYEFVQVLAPRDIWHPNVSIDPAQVLCLGDHLPAGIRIRELVLMVYGALTMQTMPTDPADPGGVMNGRAATWWQDHIDLVPLTRAPFLEAL